MRLLLINLILCIPFFLFAQESFDEINIYFYPEVISPSFDSCDGNENETRVRASIHIIIKQKAEIYEIVDKLLTRELKMEIHEVENFRCQMVIDFIKKGKINRTCAISPLQKVRMDENDNEYYICSKAIDTFYNNYINFFRQE